MPKKKEQPGLKPPPGFYSHNADPSEEPELKSTTVPPEPGDTEAWEKPKKRHIIAAVRNKKIGKKKLGKGRMRIDKGPTPAVETAKYIAAKLEEKKTGLLIGCVKALGVPKALELLKKTIEVVDEGGMLTSNKDRKKTKGGVFIQLFRESVSSEVYQAVKKKDKENSAKRKAKYQNQSKMVTEGENKESGKSKQSAEKMEI
eukprot:TRINITY_DN346_c0_g1_i1.p1 TRINITY_DN346_c0_g1~~TRINITY_DN346_c0_g1_i1.p1  ORF type:complete len:201 (-),score=56.80 TRINITY_DN346_c0_g1_i1:165-767(-)